MSQDKKNVRENVLMLTQLFPDIVGDYRQILRYYWAVYDKVVNLNDITKATPPETISRAYRALVSIGKIKAPKKDKPIVVKAEVKSDFASL